MPTPRPLCISQTAAQLPLKGGAFDNAATISLKLPIMFSSGVSRAGAARKISEAAVYPGALFSHRYKILTVLEDIFRLLHEK